MRKIMLVLVTVGLFIVAFIMWPRPRPSLGLLAVQLADSILERDYGPVCEYVTDEELKIMGIPRDSCPAYVGDILRASIDLYTVSSGPVVVSEVSPDGSFGGVPYAIASTALVSQTGRNTQFNLGVYWVKGKPMIELSTLGKAADNLVAQQYIPQESNGPVSAADQTYLRLVGFRANRSKLESIGVKRIANVNIGMTNFSSRSLDEYDSYFEEMSQAASAELRRDVRIQ